MTSDLKAYRVFIASPGGLQNERDAFRRVLNQYNEDEAVERGVYFIPVGWELTLPGKGRPQAIINSDIRRCDYFVLLLHDRWGSPTAPQGQSGYSSGCEEEWEVANGTCPPKPNSMMGVVALFKAVPYRQMADPGDELKKVIEFRKKLEREKTHLFQTFDEMSEFERHLRRLLGQWVRDDEGESSAFPTVGGPLMPISPATPLDLAPLNSLVLNPVAVAPAPVTGTGDAAAQPQSEATASPAGPASSLVDQAERLADEGSLSEAEELFTQAASSGTDLDAMNRFGHFLDRVGQVARAQEMYAAVEQLAQKVGDLSWTAIASGNLGLIEQARGNLDAAEAYHKKALEINEKLGRPEGMASQYGNLGLIEQTRGNLDAAEGYLKKSLAIDEKLGRPEGMANQYGNLGLIERELGNLDAAEGYLKKSLAINEKVGRPEGMAIQYGNLGLIERERGNLEAAEGYLKKSLEIEEKLGNQERIATNFANLGVIEETRGNLDAARELWTRALNLFLKIGMKPQAELVRGLLDGLGGRGGEK